MLEWTTNQVDPRLTPTVPAVHGKGAWRLTERKERHENLRQTSPDPEEIKAGASELRRRSRSRRTDINQNKKIL